MVEDDLEAACSRIVAALGDGPPVQLDSLRPLRYLTVAIRLRADREWLFLQRNVLASSSSPASILELQRTLCGDAIKDNATVGCRIARSAAGRDDVAAAAAAQPGCACFFAVPLARAGGGSGCPYPAALLLGFGPGKEQAVARLRLGRSLADRLSRSLQLWEQLRATGAAVHLLVAPVPSSRDSGSGSDVGSDDAGPSDEDGEEEGESGAGADPGAGPRAGPGSSSAPPVAPQQGQARRASARGPSSLWEGMSLLTLRFEEREQERKFRLWHARSQHKASRGAGGGPPRPCP